MRSAKVILLVQISLWLFSFLYAEAGLLGGVCRNDEGSGMPLAKLELFCEAEAFASISTDAAGAYIVSGLKPGFYTLKIQHPGYFAWQREFNIKSNGLYILNPRLQKLDLKEKSNWQRAVKRRPLPLSGAYVQPDPAPADAIVPCLKNPEVQEP